MLGDIKIKKGTFLNVPTIANNFDERLHTEPERFNPQRFLDKDSLTNRKIAEHPMNFILFSAGQRNCVGQHLAMNETRGIFAIFLKNFDYEQSDPNFVPRLDFKFNYEFNVPWLLNLKPKKA